MHGSSTPIELEDFCIDPLSRRVWRRDGARVPMTPRVFDTLLYLLEHPGVVVQKKDLMAAIWPDRIVEENNLNQSISALRRALDEGRGGERYILTIPGRGYKFIGQIKTRPQHAGEIVAGSSVVPLRRPASSAPRPMAAVTETAKHSPARVMAVLPFRGLVRAHADEALVMGMAEVLIARLSDSGELVVRPLSLVRRYDATDRDPLAAGRDLKAELVLDGSVQRDEAQLRVTARLLRVADGVALWARSFDVRFTNVFEVQDAIAGHVCQALELRLGSEAKRRLTRRDTNDVNAYQCYLSGRHHIARLTASEIRKGIALFEQATMLDPRYALAYAGAADAYRRLPIACDWRPTEAFPQAEAAARKALALDDTLAAAHFALGFVRFWYDWNWDEAEREFRRAMELGPASAEPHLGLAHLLSNLGRQNEAIAEIQHARELDPLSLIANTLEASFLSLAGRDEEALARLRKTFDIDPDFWVAHLHLGVIQFANHRITEALEALQNARKFSGNVPHTLAMLGYVHGSAGDCDSARALLAELHALSVQRYVPPCNYALIHCAMEQSDQALSWLERAYAERDLRLTFLRIDRRWDALRADVRFTSLTRRVGLDLGQ
jgi:DNA-binding winged helix-turn-helix (wHTH) protein/tetratricopeptide (TPR) repeat protein